MNNPDAYYESRPDSHTADRRFAARKEFDAAFGVYKQLDKNFFALKNVLTTESTIIYYEDIYDVNFSVYEGLFLSLLRANIRRALSYQIFGTIAENIIGFIDAIMFILLILILILAPITLLENYWVLCIFLILLAFLQVYFAVAIRGIYKILILPICLLIVSFALIVARQEKADGMSSGGHLIENNFLCVTTSSLGNYISFEHCDEQDKIYIWIAFGFAYIGSLLSLFIYLRVVRRLLPELTRHNFYLYVMRQLREHPICVTISHIRRSPASKRNYLNWWSTDISEKLYETTVWAKTEHLTSLLDDVTQGTESGQIKLKHFKIGRENKIVLDYLKEMIENKPISMENDDFLNKISLFLLSAYSNSGFGNTNLITGMITTQSKKLNVLFSKRPFFYFKLFVGLSTLITGIVLAVEMIPSSA